MQHSVVYCPVHGLFSRAIADHSCPRCGRNGEPDPALFAGLTDNIDVLLDPKIPVKTLLSLRQIALAAGAGLLTPEQAARGAARVAVHLAHLFGVNLSGSLYLELAEAFGEVLKARSSDRNFAQAEPDHVQEDQGVFD
jgi:hypothetical protein